mmetsp:Transcript_15244/g.17988  ORF Transcript_15244/g.17988 Transcript_15244/m.17988 type:complete len:446 (-) Transcript_15244:9-1346(-)
MKNIRLFSWKNFVAAVLEDFIGNSYYHAEADAAVEFEIAAKISRLKVFLAQELELPLPPPPESWKVVWISICFAFLLFWCSCSYDKDIGRMLFSLFTSALVASKSCSTQIIQSLHMCVSPVRKWSTHIVEMEIENGLLQKLLNLNATWNIISVYKYHIISPTLAALVSIPTLIIMRKEKVLGLTIYACSIVLFFQFAEFVGVLMVPGFAASFILLFTLFSILSSSCRSFHLACFTFAVATIVIDNELFLNDNFLFLMIISGLFSTLCYDEIMQRIDPDNVLVSCTLRAIVLVFSGLELVQLVLNIATSKVMIGDTDTATTRFSLRSLENASFEDFSKAISSKYALKSIIEVFCPVYATVGIIRALVQRKTKFTHVLLSFALISTASSVASFLTTGSKLLKHTSSSLLTVTASLTWILSEVITKWQESKILESIEGKCWIIFVLLL